MNLMIVESQIRTRKVAWRKGKKIEEENQRQIKTRQTKCEMYALVYRWSSSVKLSVKSSITKLFVLIVWATFHKRQLEF